MLLSFALQLIAVAVGVIVSVVTVDKLGAFSLPQPMPPAPRSIKAVEVVGVKRHPSPGPTTGIQAPARPVFEPRRIPTGLLTFVDTPDLPMGSGPAITDGNGPVGAVDFNNPLASIGATRIPPPPPSAPRKQESRAEVGRVKLGGVVMEAKLVKRVIPVYPPLAKQMRVSGVVRLEGVIARDGRVVNLQIIHGHPLLAAAAVNAVRQWLYTPTLLNGEAVEVIAPIDVNFILN